MFMSLSTVLNNNKFNCKNGGAYWNRGTYLQNHILWGGAYWKEGAKSNHYGTQTLITMLINGVCNEGSFVSKFSR